MPTTEQDINYQLAALPLGQYGVDLRRPPAAPALEALDNARFLDERTVMRRHGFLGTTLLDGSPFPGAGGVVNPAPWVYGLGRAVGVVSGLSSSAVHHPIAGRGAAVFELDNEPVAWTGDRLLLPTSADHGTSDFWTGNTGVSVPEGIPAFLPLMTDTLAAFTETGTSRPTVSAALTEQYELYVTRTTTAVVAQLIDRAGGVLLPTDLTGTSTSPLTPTVLVVSGIFHVMWLDGSDAKLRYRRYVGGAWTAEDVLYPNPITMFAATTSVDGETLVIVVVDTASGDVLTIKRTWHSQIVSTLVALTAIAAATAGLGLMLDANDNALVAYATSGGNVRVDFVTAAASSLRLNLASPITDPTIVGITARGTISTAVTLGGINYTLGPWAVYWASNDPSHARDTAACDQSGDEVVYFNMAPASQPWTVGVESFIWLCAVGSTTNLLLAGINNSAFVAGAADDEVSPFNKASGFTVTAVARDPLDPTGTTWLYARPYIKQIPTATTITYGVLLGLINFLPQLSVAAYGHSNYLSGSCVKNWDGLALIDAGFNDTPAATAASAGSGGALTSGGSYEWRVKAVLYNNKGERFESSANTVQLTLSGTTAQLTIAGVMCTARDQVTLEIYRTTNAGSTFFLEGVAANPTSSRSVVWTSTASDTVLENGDEEDSTAPGGEIPTSAPTGCAYLSASGDRLWGAGGQVPPGRAIFSKRSDDGFGAGFDALAGFIDFATVAEDVATISSVNDAPVISTPTRWYVLGGAGPDNFGNGSYAAPQMTMAVGATSGYGTVLTPLGLAYWSAGGPALLSPNFQTQFIAAAVRPMAQGLLPVGVQIDTARQEVLWVCAASNGVSRALLMNYATGTPRWATWTLPAIAGASPNYLVTAGGVLLQESTKAFGDNGAPFAFTLKTGNVDPQQLLAGAMRVRRAGITGSFAADHKLRLRMYYDGSPGWSDEFTWDPTAGTWLTSIADVGSLTPAEVDATQWADKSGKYRMTNRVSRQECSYLQVEVSDIGASGQTMLPFELEFELGVPRQGLGRGVVQTITRAQ